MFKQNTVEPRYHVTWIRRHSGYHVTFSKSGMLSIAFNDDSLRFSRQSERNALRLSRHICLFLFKF